MPRRLLIAGRTLTAQPGTTLACLAVVALGVGAAVAAFAALDGLLLRPLPYPQPERLVSLFETNAAGQPTDVALLTVQEWAERLDALDGLGAYRMRSFLLEDVARTTRFVAWNGMATAGFLPAIGVPPAAGRLFSAAEETAESAVAVLAWSIAERLFGSAERAPGETILLNERAHEIVGVLPAGFEFLAGARVPDLYTPVSHATYGNSRGVRALSVVGRLAPGAGLEQLDGELGVLAEAFATAHPETHAGVNARARSLHDAQRGANVRPLLLMGLAAVVLLGTAVANATGLWLDRSLARGEELGVRRALGARTRQLASGFAAEGLLLAVSATALGTALASALLGALPTLLGVLGGAPAAMAVTTNQAVLDARALGVAGALAALVAVAFTLAPLTVARRADAAALLRGQGATGRFSAAGARHALAVGQVALCVAVASGSGLLLRTLVNLLETDPGYSTSNVVRFGIGIPEARYDSDDKMIEFHRQLTRQLEEIPGVDAVGATANLALGGRTFRTRFAPVGDSTPSAEQPRSAINVVTPGYFDAMRIDVVAGRLPTWDDNPDSERVVAVNAAFAGAYLGGQTPLGTQLELGWRSAINPSGTPWRIVGIVTDTRDVDLAVPPEPTIFLPASQYPVDGGAYMLRTQRSVADLRAAVEGALRATDPDLQEIALSTMDARLTDSVAAQRLSLILAIAVTAAVLAISGFGLYAVVAVDTRRRQREHGIRRALGATPARIAWLVVRSSARLGAVGVVVGAPLAMLAGQLLRARLVGVEPIDPATLLGVAAVALSLTVVAAIAPALRAQRRDLAEIMRSS